MVSKPTVLVVGAGASQPYSYPSGSGLVSEIISSIRFGSRNKEPLAFTELGKKLLSIGFTVERLNLFRDELRNSQVNSVDAFLERRSEFADIGKAAIAAALMPYELSKGLFEKGDWYRYLLNQLLTNLSAGADQPLTILTYNYDRSLDHYLYTSLKAALGANEEKMTDLFTKITIIHLHGSLGKLPWQTIDHSENLRAYGEIGGDEELKGAAAKIKIIHENEDDSPSYQEARKHLGSAYRVCFLGFGYHRTNMRRLMAGNWKESKNQGQIIGSAYELTGAEQQQRLEYCGGGIKMAHWGWMCDHFLKENVWVIS